MLCHLSVASFWMCNLSLALRQSHCRSTCIVHISEGGVTLLRLLVPFQIWASLRACPTCFGTAIQLLCFLFVFTIVVTFANLITESSGHVPLNLVASNMKHLPTHFFYCNNIWHIQDLGPQKNIWWACSNIDEAPLPTLLFFFTLYTAIILSGKFSSMDHFVKSAHSLRCSMISKGIWQLIMLVLQIGWVSGNSLAQAFAGDHGVAESQEEKKLKSERSHQRLRLQVFCLVGELGLTNRKSRNGCLLRNKKLRGSFWLFALHLNIFISLATRIFLAPMYDCFMSGKIFCRKIFLAVTSPVQERINKGG